MIWREGNWEQRWIAALVAFIVSKSEKRRKERLRELEIMLPPLDEARNEKYSTTTSDVLARRAERKRKLYHVMQDVQRRRIHCDSLTTSFQDSNATAIPRHILQPNYGSWFRPRNGRRMTTVPFEEHDMNVLIRENFPLLLQLYERSSVEKRLILWSLCAMYKYGGYIFGSKVCQMGVMIDGLVELRDACEDIAAFIVAREPSGDQLDFLMLAASPGHPMLKCALDRLQNIGNATDHQWILKVLYSSQSWSLSEGRRSIESENVPVSDSWEVISSECLLLQVPSCCDDVHLSISENVESRQENTGKKQTRVFVRVASPNHSNIDETVGDRKHDSPYTKVSITERPNIPPPVKYVKTTIRDVMKKSKCNAGWRCNRCLHNPVYGTYESCARSARCVS